MKLERATERGDPRLEREAHKVMLGRARNPRHCPQGETGVGWRQVLRDSPTVLGAPRARAAQSPVNGTNIAELGTWTFEEG